MQNIHKLVTIILYMTLPLCIL